MSNIVVLFEPRNARDAKVNVNDFIGLCSTKLKPFGRDIVFNDNTWDVSGLGIKAKARYKAFLKFTSMVPGKKDDLPEMKEPFRSFAKAILSYTCAMKPTKGFMTRLWALRYLEFSLSNITGSTCPTATTPQVLDFACQTMMDLLGEYAAYAYSKQLEVLYEFMVKLRLVAVPTQWKTIVSACDSHRGRVGREFDSIRTKRLPDPAALMGLAQVFNAPKVPLDTLTSSVCALMLCTPDRISEVMHLPLDCIAAERELDNGKAIGLRWHPAKGAAPIIKWVIPSMSDIAKLAIENLIDLTRPAREVARWYENNPTKLFLPSNLEYLRTKEWLSSKELGCILFNGKISNAAPHTWARNNHIKKIKETKEVRFLFSDVELAVIKKLPPGFPVYDKERGMLYSEALFIARDNEFDNYRATYQCIVMPIEYGTIQSDIARNGSNVFIRNEIRGNNGEYCFLNTHALRHYLNTLAQSGGLGENDIAMWSGRKQVAQNAVYNHVSDRDVIAILRNAVGDESRAIGPIAHINSKLLVSRDEFANLKIVTAHTTEFGYCIHDYTMLPCQVHGDCLNCNEQVCVKGDVVREANIRRQRDETRKLMNQALVAMEEDEYGANRWVMHQELTLKRLDQLCSILDDPSVIPGTIIQPNGIIPASRLKQAAESRRALTGSADNSLPNNAKPLLSETME